MATTSQTYSSNSLIPTSTLTSGSSTPSNPNGTTDTISDIFSSNGSPPLIVAFLAIGLFVVVMVGVFGWRRLSRSRGQNHQSIIPNRRHKSISLGKRPVLWDLWADPKVPEESPIDTTRWENLTPMTAILTCLRIRPVHSPPVDPPPIRSVDPNGHTLLGILRDLLATVKRFYFPDPPPPQPPPPPPPEEKEIVPSVSRTSDEIEWGDASSVHVSVILTMPTQRRCCSRQDTDPEGMELGEFCIGTMDVPWSGGD